jgi:xanthine dehydrogenase small subunit
MLHGKQLITVENLRDGGGALHPVQRALVEAHGSQCGFCTPGIVMSLYAMYRTEQAPGRAEVEAALDGNLCRCTGYRPIIDAAINALSSTPAYQRLAVDPRSVELLESIPVESLVLHSAGQDFFQPRTLSEALVLIKRHPSAVVLCGGTDVALRVTKKHEPLPLVLDLSAIKELKKYARNDDRITIGSCLPIADLAPMMQEDYPAIAEMASVFGSRQIRNLATLGGNVGTASPIGDMLPVLIAYQASVVLQSLSGKRTIRLSDFFTGYRRTEREPDELIVALVVPAPERAEKVRAYKVSKRKDLDISTVSGGFRLELNDRNEIRNVTLAYGGMADRVRQASTAERFLVGKKWNRAVVTDAMPLIGRDFSPISDARGSAEFRSIAAQNLLMKFWLDTSS